MLSLQPKGKRRRRLLARVAIGSLLLMVLTFAAFDGPSRWKTFQRNRWERAECARLLTAVLNDAPAPGTVAFEEDTTKAITLAKLPDYALFTHPLTDGSGARRRPPALAKLDPRSDVVDGQPVKRFHSILFVHERHAPSGPASLVVVEGVVNWETGSPGQTHLLPVATIFATDAPGVMPLKPISTTEGPMIDASLAGDPAWGLRVFTGQIDPRDDSHFWIDYQTADGGKGTIDGWLRKSALAGGKNEVELKLR
jgi:hypothetical protein